MFDTKLPIGIISLDLKFPPTVKLAFKETSPADTTEPVNDGAARGALSAKALVNAVLTIDPPINKLPLNELSEATRRPAFKETSYLNLSANSVE